MSRSIYPSLLFSLCALLMPPSRGQERNVDFRYAPAESCTLICLPGDWLKTAASSSGALMYDFGPGPYGRGLTSVEVGIREDSLRVTAQYFADPRVPILTTRLAGHGTDIEERAFSLVPEGWLHAGARIELDNVLTDLGRIRFRLEISRSGRSAGFTTAPVKGGKTPPHMRLDLLPLSRAGFSEPDGSRLPEHIDIPQDRTWTIEFQRPAR